MKRIKKALKHPIRTMGLINRRYLQLGVKTSDPVINNMNGWCYGGLKREPLAEIFPGIEDVSIQVLNAHKRTFNMSISLEELGAVLAVLKFKKCATALEIGTYDGNLALNLAANLPEGGRVFTVDYPEGHGGLAVKISDFNDNRSAKPGVGSQFTGSEFRNRIELIFSDSAKLDYDRWKKTGLDLVFIDGCHDHEYVRIDSENALRTVSPGGVVIWHDYGMLEDVSSYVDELARKVKLRSIAGTRLVVYERPAA